MIFFNKWIIIKVTEQINNPIIGFTANFKVLSNKLEYNRKITKSVFINIEITTIYLNPLII